MREISLNEVAAEWLAEVHSTKKYPTYVKYKGIYEKYLGEKYGNTMIYDIQNRFQLHTAAGSVSIQKSIRIVLNQMIKYANYHYNIHLPGLLPQSYANAKPNRSIAVFNTSEQQMLLQYLFTNMDITKLCIYLCLITGLRLGEICSLKWTDIDLDRNILCVSRTVQRIALADDSSSKTALIEFPPKTACSKREIPISNDTVQLLKRFKKASGSYILTPEKPTDPRTLQYRYKKYLKDAGIKPTNFHTLRHTFATNCIASGADVKSVSEILGHSNVQITLNRYVHPSFETKLSYINSLDNYFRRLYKSAKCIGEEQYSCRDAYD